MNKKILIIIISSAVVLISAAGVLLHRNIIQESNLSGFRHQRMHMPSEHGMLKGNRIGRHFCNPGFMKDTLELQDSQIKKIETLNKNFENRHMEYSRKITPARKQLREILKSRNPDLARARELLEEISAVNIELRMLRIRQGIEISHILSPEQMKMLREERRKTFRKRGRYFWQE